MQPLLLLYRMTAKHFQYIHSGRSYCRLFRNIRCVFAFSFPYLFCCLSLWHRVLSRKEFILVHGIDDVIFNRLLSLLVKLVPEKLLKFLNIFMKRGIQNVEWYFIFVSLGLHSSTFFIRSHYYFHYLIGINLIQFS